MAAAGSWPGPLAEITLRDVYEAVGHPPLFNIGAGAEPAECLVEKAVDARLEATLKDAEARLLAEFAATSVEHIAQDFERRYARMRGTAVHTTDTACGTD